MPKMLPIDKDSGIPVITYIHESQSNPRVQLEATDDVRDVRGRIIERGETKKADFVRGKFATNRKDYIDLLEDSIAYKTGKIERLETLEKRSNDRLLEQMLDVARKHPAIARELRSRLTKEQMAAKATGASAVVASSKTKAPTEAEEENDAPDLYGEDGEDDEEDEKD